MDYRTTEEARHLPGMRLVLAVGLPNAWGEAAKGVFHVRSVDYVPVARVGLDDDPELLAWTGQQNVPVAVYEDERPRSGWLDILYLAERVGTGPSLLPDDLELRAQSIGLSHQICGEDGLGWNRRLDMYRTMSASRDGAGISIPKRLYRDYRIDDATMAVGTDRLVALMKMFDARVRCQRAAGSPYLVGDRLTGTDIHFATIFGTVDPLPEAVNPMPGFLRGLYESGSPEVRSAVTADLRSHRDHIYATHLKLPMTF